MTHVRETSSGTNAAQRQAQQRHERIGELYLTGLPEAAIAKEMGCCLRTVQRALIKIGAREKQSPCGLGTPMTEAEKARAKSMLEDGQSYHAVAQVLGRYMGTIERNVPGYRKLTMAERAERAVLGRQLRRLERRLRL